MTDLILFGDSDAAIYSKSDIYDPDIDGTNVQASGKIVPAILSIVIDNTIIYIVESVDPVTYKSTLVPTRIVTEEGGDVDQLISYGNDQYMLYYDDRVSPTKLIIDSKVILFGSNSVEYLLTKESDNVITSIGLYIDSTGEIHGDRIPMTSVATGMLKPANCHTLSSLSEGDTVKLSIFDGAGVLTTIITLTAKNAPILNDLSSSANPITGFNVTCSQELDGDWVLYLGQNPEHLAIFPELVYSDGTKYQIPINNQNCFLYGMEDVESNYPGLEYTVLLKYFMPAYVESTLADENRSISLEKNIVVMARSKDEISKISAIPIWNTSTSKWDMKYFAYYQSRNTFEDVTNSIEYTPGMAYDPTIINDQQLFQIKLIYIPEAIGTTAQTYIQDIVVTLRIPSDSEPWIIAPSIDAAFVYGSNDALHIRPVIHYDSSLTQYFVPTSKFVNSNKLIENFYTNSTPPYLVSSEVVAPTPDYFTIREVSSGRVLLSSPIAIAEYEQAFNMLHLNTPNQFVNTTVIVEFLIKNGNLYTLLYGVPVEVRTSPTGYNQ